jgi:hypothetical protein
MKKLFPLLSIVFAAFIACQPNGKPKEEDNLKAKADSIATYDSILNELKKIEEQKKNEDSDKIVSSISIIKYFTSRPNSAGGVDANIVWKNKSEKTIKYARFTIVPYNAVEDMVSSEIGGETDKIVRVTGPIKPGATYGYDSTWECIWYNSSITHMQITGVELEFMDKTILSTDDTETIKRILPKRK